MSQLNTSIDDEESRVLNTPGPEQAECFDIDQMIKNSHLKKFYKD